MAKPSITPWDNPELLLYLQSQINTVGMQVLKITHETLRKAAPAEEFPTIEDRLLKSLFNWEQAQKSLLAKNPDVYVELHFPNENKKDIEVMSYKVVHAKLVEWTRASVNVTWWPVNFKDHGQAKKFVSTYLEALFNMKEEEVKA